jgi:hypothetical protein
MRGSRPQLQAKNRNGKDSTGLDLHHHVARHPLPPFSGLIAVVTTPSRVTTVLPGSALIRSAGFEDTFIFLLFCASLLVAHFQFAKARPFLFSAGI